MKEKIKRGLKEKLCPSCQNKKGTCKNCGIKKEIHDMETREGFNLRLSCKKFEEVKK